MVLAQIETLPNNYSNVAATHRSPRGHKSQNHHPGMESSHRPPTCPRLVPAILFSVPTPLLSQILTLEYFGPQSRTLRSTLPSSRGDEASEGPPRRLCTETPKAVGENSWPLIRNGAQQHHCGPPTKQAGGRTQQRPNGAEHTRRTKANGNTSSENTHKRNAYLRDTGPLRSIHSPLSLCTHPTSSLKQLCVWFHASFMFQDAAAAPCLHLAGARSPPPAHGPPPSLSVENSTVDGKQAEIKSEFQRLGETANNESLIG